MGRYGEIEAWEEADIWGDLGRSGRSGEIWGDLGRYGCEQVEMDAWEEADLPGEQQWAGMLQRAGAASPPPARLPLGGGGVTRISWLGISEPSGSLYLSEAAARLVMCTSDACCVPSLDLIASAAYSLGS